MSAIRVLARRRQHAAAEALWVKADVLIDAGKRRRGARLCRQAAHMGCASAQVLLGDLYSEEGPTYHFRSARRWYLRAYHSGDAAGANNYGQELRLRGRYLDAIRWLSLAAAEGDLHPHLWIAKIYLSIPGSEHVAARHLQMITAALPCVNLSEDYIAEARDLLLQYFPSECTIPR